MSMVRAVRPARQSSNISHFDLSNTKAGPTRSFLDFERGPPRMGHACGFPFSFSVLDSSSDSSSESTNTSSDSARQSWLTVTRAAVQPARGASRPSVGSAPPPARAVGRATAGLPSAAHPRVASSARSGNQLRRLHTRHTY